MGPKPVKAAARVASHLLHRAVELLQVQLNIAHSAGVADHLVAAGAVIGRETILRDHNAAAWVIARVHPLC